MHAPHSGTSRQSRTSRGFPGRLTMRVPSSPGCITMSIPSCAPSCRLQSVTVDLCHSALTPEGIPSSVIGESHGNQHQSLHPDTGCDRMCRHHHGVESDALKAISVAIAEDDFCSYANISPDESVESAKHSKPDQMVNNWPSASSSRCKHPASRLDMT